MHSYFIENPVPCARFTLTPCNAVSLSDTHTQVHWEIAIKPSQSECQLIARDGGWGEWLEKARLQTDDGAGLFSPPGDLATGRSSGCN